MTADQEKIIKIYKLLDSIFDPMVRKFFDTESEKNLDQKIEVLEALKAGKAPADIPHYYDVLELMPTNQPWDL